ncbi:MAG: phage tail protein I [Hyphomicrobium sp. 32-62-53]|nr:MAG: phage tail protein I [Hyphomicrobium sp. 12-62-95]OYY01423.1 MAG: phage tail protein I [Hyphomicrobium sp. 32-62-53]
MMPETAAAIMGHILPRENATPLEIGLDLALESRVLDIPVPIRDLWRWDTCPETHIPWLAWSFSIDVWDENWPIEKKRGVIRQWVDLHRLKGTLEGVRRHVEIVGGRVVRVVRPPIKAFAGRIVTPAEHLAYLERFRQVRIYKFRDRAPAKVRGQFPRRANFVGYHMPRLSDAYLRTGSQFFLWDKGSHPLASGEEKQITFQTEIDRQRIQLPGRKPARAAYPNAMLRKLHPVKSTAAVRFFTINAERAQEDLTAFRLLRSATPGQRVIDLQSRTVAERGVKQFGSVFPGQCLSRAYLPDTTSGFRLYDVLYLHDEARADKARKARVFAGHQRLGIDPFRAELTIEVRGKKPKSANFAGGAVGMFPRVADQTMYENVKRAVVSSKAYRDKVLINTSTTRKQTFLGGIPLDGSRTFSSTVSAAN